MINKLFKGVKSLFHISDQVGALTDILYELNIRDILRTNEKYQNSLNLNRFELSVYSQNGEDGIIDEISHRIGMTNAICVEFGISALENNTLALLLKGWKGLWLDGSDKKIGDTCRMCASLIESENLVVKHERIGPDNIEALLQQCAIPKEFGLLSIDIDGNDYWVWEAINNFNPKVVVIEYNAILGPSIRWVMKYNPGHLWDGTSYFGASLKSLEDLGHKKGYSLVACNMSGSNAFFVRSDLLGDKFAGPFNSEHHFEPPRYKYSYKPGHSRGFGKFEMI